MAQRDYPPSVIIRIGKLDMSTVGSHSETTNFVTETCLLPSSIFPILDPVAWSATFLKIMYKICHNITSVFVKHPAPMSSTAELLTRRRYWCSGTLTAIFYQTNGMPRCQRMTKWQFLSINFVKNKQITKIDSFNLVICCIFAPSFNIDQLW